MFLAENQTEEDLLQTKQATSIKEIMKFDGEYKIS